MGTLCLHRWVMWLTQMGQPNGSPWWDGSGAMVVINRGDGDFLLPPPAVQANHQQGRATRRDGHGHHALNFFFCWHQVGANRGPDLLNVLNPLGVGWGGRMQVNKVLPT